MLLPLRVRPPAWKSCPINGIPNPQPSESPFKPPIDFQIRQELKTRWAENGDRDSEERKTNEPVIMQTSDKTGCWGEGEGGFGRISIARGRNFEAVFLL